MQQNRSNKNCLLPEDCVRPIPCLCDESKRASIHFQFCGSTLWQTKWHRSSERNVTNVTQFVNFIDPGHIYFLYLVSLAVLFFVLLLFFRRQLHQSKFLVSVKPTWQSACFWFWFWTAGVTWQNGDVQVNPQRGIYWDFFLIVFRNLSQLKLYKRAQKLFSKAS